MFQPLWAILLAGVLLVAVTIFLFVGNVVMGAMAQANSTLYKALGDINRTAPYAVKVQQAPRSAVYDWLAQNIGTIAVIVAGVIVVAALLRTPER